jgi:DNA-binding beta-propeller fold protein YncE
LLLLAGCGLGSPVRPEQRHCGESGVICTAAGTGDRAYDGDGNLALETSLYYPIDLAFDPQGRLVVLDWNNQRLRRVDPDGRVRTLLGTGFEGEVEEGGRAIETPMHHAFSLAYDAAGNFYVAGNHQPQIMQVGPDGVVHLIAGADAIEGFGGDGGPARAAQFSAPCGIAAAAAGRPLFVADTGNNRIRMVDAQGFIHTLAGTGEAGYSGDGGPAQSARLDAPYRVRLDPATGDLYVCDTQNHAIRRIDPEGKIWAVAGNGEPGWSGDGGPATSARLQLPYDVAIAPDGALYIADTGNDRVRRVGADGRITTIAGTGVRGYSGDGGDARNARLNHPSALALDAEGDLWIADTFNSRVRVIAY